MSGHTPGRRGEAHIKVRRAGERRWRFLGSGGSAVNLRVHAIRWVSLAVAERIAADVSRLNPRVETKVAVIARAEGKQ
jgi:hypothetical protein